MIRLRSLFLVLCLSFFPSHSWGLDTQARAVVLMDADSGTILYEKDADEALPPASMSKLMTAYLVFSRLADGRAQLDDLLTVSEKAWRMEGSKMWVEVGEQVSIENLIRGMVIQSGNDATVALAEGLGGSEEAFVAEMNAKAKELGLTHSHFANVTGWPDPNHYMTARDLATLSLRLIKDFPQYYHYYSETQFTWANITQPNRNPLLGRGLGVDGLKTGHTEEAGYCLIATGVQEGRRIILVVFGLPDEKTRAEEGERLLLWGFREFATYMLFAAGEMVDEAPVWNGEVASVPLQIPQAVEVSMLRSARAEMKVTLRYQAPLTAPIAAGQEVAVLSIEAPGFRTLDLPVVAAQAVEERGFFDGLMAKFSSLIGG